MTKYTGDALTSIIGNARAAYTLNAGEGASPGAYLGATSYDAAGQDAAAPADTIKLGLN